MEDNIFRELIIVIWQALNLALLFEYFSNIFSQPSKVFFPYIEDIPAYLTTDMCYPDGKVDSARKSFPSGHTSMAFAGSTFIALLCYHWLVKWQGPSGFHQIKNFDIPGPSIAIAMFFVSYVPAFFTAISRTQVSQSLFSQ